MKHVTEHSLLLKDARHFVPWPTVEASAKYGAGNVLFRLSLSRVPYNVPAHAGFLCDKTAVLGAAIKISCRYSSYMWQYGSLLYLLRFSNFHPFLMFVVPYSLVISVCMVFSGLCAVLNVLMVAQLPGGRLEISTRKVLRSATSAQVFLFGFPVSKSKCWDGSHVSKLTLRASHVALPK
jgi:hypothetical protein